MRFSGLLCLVVACPAVFAQHPGGGGPNRLTILVTGLGSHHHPVSTKDPRAQRFFDQGLTYIFAFNHDEAVRSFKRAAELDPKLAVAHWGIALALGPNINADVDAAQEKAAFTAVHEALKMAADAPAPERAYIEALTKRYSDDPKADLKKLALDYKNAMGELVKRYPDDVDAAVLYAESAMDLRPWMLWSADGKPAEGTEEIVAVLESVLRRRPNHPGANHYYIHAVEASPHPERALAAADRLKSLVPAAGHLVHMPSHIYIRVGDYEEAARRNDAAAKVDMAYLKRTGATGIYPMMYYSHNLHFLAVAHAMQGRFSDAKKAADQLAAHVGPAVKEMAMLEGFMPTPTLILVRFRRWEEILQLPQPDPAQKISTALWRFARGLAYSATGKQAIAEEELKQFQASRDSIPVDAGYGPRNKAADVLAVAENLIRAQIAIGKDDSKQAIEALNTAVGAEDKLNYMEPKDWYIPVRETLGGVLLRNRLFAEAEKVFRADLDKNPRSGRSLFGLAESLKGQGKHYEASMVELEYQEAWKNADTKLRIEDL
jgi:tetratricopeptide (TPR) repeat protein